MEQKPDFKRTGALARVSLVLSNTGLRPKVRPLLLELQSLRIECTPFLADLSLNSRTLQQWLREEESRAGAALVLVVSGGTDAVAQFAAAVTRLPVLQVALEDSDWAQFSRGIRHEMNGLAAVDGNMPRQAAECIARILARAAKDLLPILRARRQADLEALARDNEAMQLTLAGTAQPPPKVTWPTTDGSDHVITWPLEEPTTKRAEIEYEYTRSLRQVIAVAGDIAAAYDNQEVRPEHFLAAILDTPCCGAHKALVAAAGDLQGIAGHLIGKFCTNAGVTSGDEGAREMLGAAKDLARSAGRHTLSTVDLLRGLVAVIDSLASDALWESGITAYKLQACLQEALAEELGEGCGG